MPPELSMSKMDSSTAVIVLRLAEAGDNHRSLVGGKAFNLGKLIAAALPVPRGFCVTTTAFDLFLASCPRRTDLSRLLAQCSGDEIGRFAELSRKVHSCLTEVHVPEVVKDVVLGAWRELGGERSFAVRSSATVEDAAGMSFAGQFESILNVRGEAALLAAIKTCWLSLFSERALVYLARQRVPAEKVRMAVLVQEMVAAGHAGVVFTADPVTGATDRFVVEYVSGLGEGLVQGTIQPGRAVIEKRTGRVVVSPEKELLSSATLENLCELARQTEHLFGSPQDIEWAQRDGAVFLLQSRPITTKVPARTWEDRQVWTNVNTGEVVPDVMTPITWSTMQSLLGLVGSIFRLVGADDTRAPLAGLVAGRMYFNANTALAVVKPFSFLHKGFPDFVRAVGGDLVEAYHQAPLAIPPEDLPDLGFRWPKYILSWPHIFYDLITHSSRRRGCAWLARFKKQTDELDRLDLGAISTPELTRLCGQYIREVFKDADVLYLLAQGAALPVFQKACRDWLGEPGLTLRLFAALGGMPVAEAGLALWRLAVLAHADGDTEAAVSSENSWLEVRARLCRAEPGRKFLAAWDAFMTEHGHHCRGEFELSNARWCETPDYILGLVRGYLRSLGRSDPLENQLRLAEERERLTVQCRARLKHPVKRWIFSHSLHRAQELTVYREQLKNLGIRRFAFVRRVLLVLGRRLHEQGSLSCRDDIFFLEVSELEPVAMGGASFDWRERIKSRRQEYEKNLELSPPRIVNGIFDPNAPGWPVADADAKLLEGIPVSPGVVTGPARVILRADEHEHVLAGEILIAPFTDPAWSPYFVTAAGVVMEQGGILSHGSIVAREYGLPAVTNVASATRVIRTGDLVQVDGNCGRVSVLKRRAEDHAA
jgi:pyruvate,water dikinase